MYLEVKDLKKIYGNSSNTVQVLKGVTLSVEKGQMCVIQGTSGSGKSTLLNCIGGLESVNSGSIKVNGKEICGLGTAELSDYRRDNLGFIFQFYNLVPNLTVKENIKVCEFLSENPLDIDELIRILSLTEHQGKFPSQLSGGQQQRCAIARA
ncbi:MAG: ATP-binding cassette domain-containing protein, partial [Ruminococcus sp.]|nr:ATP-binding cassette domain-containing protein [Ruminococcus sp.]